MRFFVEHRLTKKITVVTIIKFLGLLALWWLFFSEPVDHGLTPEQVSNAILHPSVRSSTLP